MTSKYQDSSAASSRLRELADAFDADAVSYGIPVALDILVSDLQMALDDLAAVAGEVRDA